MTSSSFTPEPHIDRVQPPRLADYRSLVDDVVLDEIDELARELRGLRVRHYNTTAKGGGVAVMLRTLLSAVAPLGVEQQAEVVALDEACCRFMARLADLLQGGGAGGIDAAEGAAFVAGVERACGALAYRPADVYWVHDVQLVPVAALVPWMRPVAFFSHLDTAAPNPSAAAFVGSFLGAYDQLINNTPWTGLRDPHGRAFELMTLGLDAFGAKNRPLERAAARARFAECGLDPERPVVVQVARFGRFKDPWQALDVHRLLRRDVPGAQLALVGALEASDDLAALEVLDDVRRHAAGVPDVHLLCDPGRIGAEQVNALQTGTDVVIQRSSREGFGLTVAEAMWKRQPVVGTSATGIRYQITHARDGFVADGAQECASHVLRLLRERELHAALGEAARESVRARFLLPLMVRDYLRLLRRLARGA